MFCINKMPLKISSNLQYGFFWISTSFVWSLSDSPQLKRRIGNFLGQRTWSFDSPINMTNHIKLLNIHESIVWSWKMIKSHLLITENLLKPHKQVRIFWRDNKKKSIKKKNKNCWLSCQWNSKNKILMIKLLLIYKYFICWFFWFFYAFMFLIWRI